MSTYRLLTYKGPSGPCAAVAVGDEVHDVGSISGLSGTTILGLMEAWGANEPVLHRFAQSQPKGGKPLASLELMAPLLYPGTIYCAGANYRDHVDNMARKLGIAPEPDPHDLGLSPWHFIKASRCVVGPGAEVELDSNFLDWEVELAVVIGKTARRIGMDHVFDHVAGYTIGNDLSARDRIQREKVDFKSPFRYDWIGQKNFDGACPLGPWIVPARDIADPQALSIRCSVNDAMKQDSSTGKMLFNIAEQISYLSSRITLHPGDVVLTGTPAGVGAETGQKLSRGDRVRAEIEMIGALETLIV